MLRYPNGLLLVRALSFGVFQCQISRMLMHMSVLREKFYVTSENDMVINFFRCLTAACMILNAAVGYGTSISGQFIQEKAYFSIEQDGYGGVGMLSYTILPWEKPTIGTILKHGNALFVMNSFGKKIAQYYPQEAFHHIVTPGKPKISYIQLAYAKASGQTTQCSDGGSYKKGYCYLGQPQLVIAPNKAPMQDAYPPDVRINAPGDLGNKMSMYANGRQYLQFEMQGGPQNAELVAPYYWDQAYPISQLVFIDAQGHAIIPNSGIANKDGLLISTVPHTIYHPAWAPPKAPQAHRAFFNARSHNSGIKTVHFYALHSSQFFYLMSAKGSYTTTITLHPDYLYGPAVEDQKNYMDKQLSVTEESPPNYKAPQFTLHYGVGTRTFMPLYFKEIGLLGLHARATSKISKPLILQFKINSKRPVLRIVGHVNASVFPVENPATIKSPILVRTINCKHSYHESSHNDGIEPWATYRITQSSTSRYPSLVIKSISHPLPAKTDVQLHWGIAYHAGYIHYSPIYLDGNPTLRGESNVANVYTHTENLCAGRQHVNPITEDYYVGGPYSFYLNGSDQYGNRFSVIETLVPMASTTQLTAQISPPQ